jgi:hypothetical protein
MRDSVSSLLHLSVKTGFFLFSSRNESNHEAERRNTHIWYRLETAISITALNCDSPRLVHEAANLPPIHIYKFNQIIDKGAIHCSRQSGKTFRVPRVLWQSGQDITESHCGARCKINMTLWKCARERRGAVYTRWLRLAPFMYVALLRHGRGRPDVTRLGTIVVTGDCVTAYRIRRTSYRAALRKRKAVAFF